MTKLNVIAEPGKQEIIMTYSFDAPRELVYRACTDPDAIPEWYGPRGLTTIVDKLEVKKGGIWRYIQRDTSGNEFAFNGVYHEVIPNERVTNTFEFEGMMGHIVMETMTLEEHDGKTLMTTKSVFQSVEDRDGMVASGMEHGARDSMERLTDLLEKLREKQ